MSEQNHHGINKLDDKKKKSMKSRIIVGVILAVVGLPALFLGGWFWFAVMSVFFGFAIYEFIHATGKKYPWYVWAFTYLLTASYAYWVMLRANLQAYHANPSTYSFGLETYFFEPAISWYAILISLGVYFLIALCKADFTLHDLTYLFTMSILVGFGFQAMFFLRYYPLALIPGSAGTLDWNVASRSSFLLVFVIALTFGNDMMAYFVGVFFGKHKMSSRVSPNKSWEGFFGGWILGGLLGFGLACVFEAVGYPILPGWTIFSAQGKWYAVLILCFTIPLIGVLGDLAMSLIKRHYGIKDYGKLLAAHGGALDRADSLMFCCMFASIMIVLFEKGSAFFYA